MKWRYKLKNLIFFIFIFLIFTFALIGQYKCYKNMSSTYFSIGNKHRYY